jgi:hypothetical protein
MHQRTILLKLALPARRWEVSVVLAGYRYSITTAGGKSAYRREYITLVTSIRRAAIGITRW